MKFLLLVGFIATTAYALSPQFIEESKKKAKEIADECISESGVTADEVANIKAMKAPNTHDGKCFVMCFQKHMGLLNSDGKLDEESALAHLEKMKHEDEELYNTLHGIFQKCYGELHDESDPCETALKLGGCMKSKANDAGLTEAMFDQ